MSGKSFSFFKKNKVRLFIFWAGMGFFRACFASDGFENTLKTPRFTLSVIDHPDIVSMFSPAVIAAYRQLGIKVNLELTKGGRGLIESSEGRTDGELVRAKVIENYTNTLLRVPVSLGSIKARLYCHTSVPCSYEVLDDPQTTVGGSDR